MDSSEGRVQIFRYGYRQHIMKPTIKQLRECANVRWEYNKGFILNKERVCKTLDILGRRVLLAVCMIIPHEFYGY